MESRPVARDGKPLFSFVVVADTHVNEDDGVSSSPYRTNALANARARHVFLDIAKMDPPPKFVVHLGDIVHPVPSLPTFQDAVTCFKEIASAVDVPLHLVPGNHDVGDKRIVSMPADQVSDSFLQVYRDAFGPDFFSFDDGQTTFIMVNSLLINSGLADEERQRKWLEGVLDASAGKRIFMFMHYPPYIYSPDERSNYDNLDEPGRSLLLNLIRRHKVEAVFAGHVHNFWYDRIGEAEFYMLPSTAFLRHDFTEFYKVAPRVEFGRGDIEKFGYFVVDVYPDGHVVHFIRTMGAQAEPGKKDIAAVRHYLAHPKTSDFDNFGVELRHPWVETMQITATGGVQEFGRKWARNDYPLLALWEMGLRLLKVPEIDLTEAQSRERMQQLARLGHRYVVTTLGVPKESLLDLDLQACGVVAFEVNVTEQQFAQNYARLGQIRKDHGVQIYYAKIHMVDPDQFDGQHFSHVIKSGFTPAELESGRSRVLSALAEGVIDGITVRVEAGENLLQVGAQLKSLYDDTGCRILASLKLSGPDSAVERADEPADVASVAQAMILSRTSSGVSYIFDTFMDVDRGYFPRRAFIDRHFNPRKMARAVTIMTDLLSGTEGVHLSGEPVAEPHQTMLEFTTSAGDYVLICADADRMHQHLAGLPPSATLHDLVAGSQTTVDGMREVRSEPEEADTAIRVVLVEHARESVPADGIGIQAMPC